MASEPEVMLPAAPAPAPVAVRHELEVDDLVAQVEKIQQVMQRVMVESNPEKGIDGHYGKIPGTNKPTLLKAGAEKLCMVFRLRPEFESVREWDGPHLSVFSRCTLIHIPTGQSFGTGEGMCSTKEKKYRERKAERVCPNCGVAAIIKSKAEWGGGWNCWAKKGGCNTKFKPGDPAIESQDNGTVENPDLADLYNTVVKMANKRSHVAATLLCTAASDLFTQDVEDLPHAAAPAAPQRKVPTPEEQKAEVLDRIKALLRKHKLMSQAARDERAAALWHAFEVRELEAVPKLDIQALRDGLSVLDAMLTQKTMPGDESVPFDEERGEKPPYET